MGKEKSDNAKNLGLVEVFCIASGAMISSGLFVLPVGRANRADLASLSSILRVRD